MHTKRIFLTGLHIGAGTFLFCALMAAPSAQAGFQWVPADNVGTSPAPAPALPLPTPSTPDFAPKIIEGPAPSTLVAPAPAPTLAPAAPTVSAAPKTLPTLPSEPLPAPVTSRTFEPLPVPEASAQPPAEKESVVRGFANNVPLSVALRQVLPPDYGFSVGQDVSLGTLVSWRGGAPWREVLKSMLLPAGLASKEEGQMIQIVPAKESSAASEGLFAPPLKLGPEAKIAPLKEPSPLQIEDLPVSGKAEPAFVPEEPKLAPLAPLPPAQPVPSRGSVPASEGRTMGYLNPPASIQPLPVRANAPLALSGQTEAFDVWSGEKGETLRGLLEKWCARAGVDLSWQSEYDYPLQARVAFSGSFEEAVRALLSGFQEAKPQPVGRLHQNQAVGQTVLVVQPRGNDYNE